jgi:two-component system nitrogen regulation sensor histidine kinase GlnL
MKPITLPINILDHLTTAVIVFDEGLHVQYLNQVAESLLAVSARHVLQQQLAPHIGCDGQSLHQLVSQAEDQAMSKRGVILMTNERTEITVDCLLNRVYEDNSPPYTIIELQQVDRQLRITRENQLISQQAATRDLVRGVAHEIKNPLGGLRGAAQLLAAELPDPELHEYTNIIIQEADRLQALVNRMLGPNRRPEYKPVNIHQVLERVRSIVLAEAGGSLDIERDYDPSIPELVGDMDQLIQALLNIVANAARALGGEGLIRQRTRIARNFTIGKQCHRLVAQIDIEDNGPGIPEEIADTLFLPMVTSGSGIGLGLSIAQSLITQHNGLVECRSKPGQTIFTILLPLRSQ